MTRDEPIFLDREGFKNQQYYSDIKMLFHVFDAIGGLEFTKFSFMWIIDAKFTNKIILQSRLQLPLCIIPSIPYIKFPF
jgi:hypothetical protein